MDVQTWPIDRVRPYEKNPRHNEAAVEKVAASLRQFGWRQPIVVDGDGIIIVGHTRHLAAQRLGMAEVPVHVAAGLTADQIRAYRIADNKTGEFAEWDFDRLREELGALPFEAQGWSGFEEYDLKRFAAERGEIEPTAMPSLPGPDKPSFQTMSFCLHDLQAADMKKALEIARAAGAEKSDLNGNTTANLLHYIAQSFIAGAEKKRGRQGH